MANTLICTKRLSKEFKQIQKCPIPNVYVQPDPNDIKTWYFLIHSLKECDYADGVYMGIVKVPANYPMRAPTFKMVTPSGRFQTYINLCTTFSQFHPEQWSANWKISTTLIGLVSFMLEDGHGIGSIKRSSEDRRKLAQDSVRYNYQNKDFKQVFVTTFPIKTNLINDLKQFNANALKLERIAAQTQVSIVSEPAPNLELAPKPEAKPEPEPESKPEVATVVVTKMELNAIIWMFLDAKVETEKNKRIEFKTFCVELAKWAGENGYRPTDHNAKITKKAVHKELKKIRPNEYIKGKYLRDMTLIT